MTTLYETLGKETSIAAVVAAFYERVLADPRLAPFFATTDMTALRAHQAAFLVAATGGPKVYDGRDLMLAHAGLGITDADFDSVAGHLVATLTDAGVDADTVGAVAAAVLPLRSSIVTAS
jgi:hemoglobin